MGDVWCWRKLKLIEFWDLFFGFNFKTLQVQEFKWFSQLLHVFFSSSTPRTFRPIIIHFHFHRNLCFLIECFTQLVLCVFVFYLIDFILFQLFKPTCFTSLIIRHFILYIYCLLWLSLLFELLLFYLYLYIAFRLNPEILNLLPKSEATKTFLHDIL